MKILVVEDDISISSFIKKGLEENGHYVEQAYDGKIALKLVSQNKYDIILLDVIIPEINGVVVCKKIREIENEYTPIIMLTALSTTDDVVEGLDAGADDYITKPFKFKELLARIMANARKLRKETNYNLSIEDLAIDSRGKKVTRNGKEINLTAKEFNLLHYLATNKGRVVSRMDILENVWDVNFDFGTNVIDVYISYLRNKVDKGFSQKLLHTVVGMGYVLKAE